MGDRITYYFSSVSSNLEVSLAFQMFFLTLKLLDDTVVGVVWTQEITAYFQLHLAFYLVTLVAARNNRD